MSRPDAIVVGGGIIGLATAYKLLLAGHRAVTVLEKERAVGLHQSGRNSGVLHAGLSYRPGSAKARLARAGIDQMVAFCAEHAIAYERCGKLVVAAEPAEVPRLEALLERGRRNGLTGLAWLGPEQIVEIEPHARGVAAVHVPEEGIVDFGRVCEVLAERIAANGGRVTTGAEVRRLVRMGDGWTAETTAGDVTAAILVTCAGLHADRVARMAGVRPSIRLVPFRGEYYGIRPERRFLVRHLIYPVPDPALPFLGVHFTRRIGGEVDAGPTAVLATAREGYSGSTVHFRDLAEALTFAGLWRFMARYPEACWSEIRRSFSRAAFCRALQRLVPEIQVADLEPRHAGVRAQAMFPDGELADDFVFARGPAALHVLNCPSPGATASLAIADEIVRRAAELVTRP